MPDFILSEILDGFRVLVHGLQMGSRNSEEQVGLTGAQLFVMEKLRGATAMTVNELAAATHTHQSTISVVVSKLVKKKLVSRVRSAEDARVQMLSITKEGEAKLRDSPETVQDRLVNALKKMSRADRDQLVSLLRRVLLDAGLSEVEPQLFLESKRK
jgi:DNA-binding MarR family transcriptional regulator